MCGLALKPCRNDADQWTLRLKRVAGELRKTGRASNYSVINRSSLLEHPLNEVNGQFSQLEGKIPFQATLMAPGTQPVSSEYSIPFALSHSQHSFRFFELPDEIVDLLASGSKPRLSLKSANKSPQSNETASQLMSASTTSGYAHLCSDDLSKSWAVRQVSTSNEVYVVQALRAKRKDASNRQADLLDEENSVALTAIAKADSVLELLPAAVDIEAHLRKLLPKYDQDQLTRHLERSHEQARKIWEDQTNDDQSIKHQIPAPDTAISQVWLQLFVSRCPRTFVSPQEQFFIPTAQLLESAWKSIFAAYNIRTSGNGKIRRTDTEDDGEDIDELAPVKAAVWTCLCSADGVSLDRKRTVQFVVRTHWESMWTSANTRSTGTEDRSELEDLWRDLLPREWNTDATIDNLEAGTYELYTLGEKDMVRWIGKSKATLGAQTTTIQPGKRKWHEKFRDSRNVKN